MPTWGPALVYGLCLGASLLCAVLLGRAYLASRSRLLLWSALCFGFLALNNLLVVADMLFLPDLDMTMARQGAALIGVSLLLIGFVWESRA
jgi:hypothetical protein